MKTVSIPEAVKLLEDGKIVIFPTDTAYGIGCAINNTGAIERLFRIRQRPVTQATPVLVSSLEMAQEYLQDIPDSVSQLMTKFWPGALTVICKARVETVPSLVRGGTETLGVRMPNNETTLEIIKRLGKPILGPSANFHGQPTPYTFESVDRNLIALADGIVDGVCQTKRESTVVNTTVNPWKIVRQGAVNLNEMV